MGAISKNDPTFAAFATLKAQFETAASLYPRLCHLLSESPDEKRTQMFGPFPLRDMHEPRQALATCYPSSDLTFRVSDSKGKPRLGKVFGLQVFQFHAYYISGSDKPLETIRSYAQGIAQFQQLADRAGNLLLSLPAKIINCYPPEWREYERFLREHRRTEVSLSGEHIPAQTIDNKSTYDAILPPCSSDSSSRWAGFLHWLGWRAETGLGFSAKRQSWTGWCSFPYFPAQKDFDDFMSNLPPMHRHEFSKTRVFYSTIEDVFLCSALAINVVIAKLSEENIIQPDAKDSDSETTGAATGTLSPSGAHSVFVSYCHADERYRKKLAAHLSPLEREGLISSWHDGEITPGSEWNTAILKQLEVADIILLLVSPDFINSDFCHGVELKRALERHQSGDATVIPVIVRPVDWKISKLAELKALPSDAKAVTQWRPHDLAYVDIAKGIRTALKKCASG